MHLPYKVKTALLWSRRKGNKVFGSSCFTKLGLDHQQNPSSQKNLQYLTFSEFTRVWWCLSKRVLPFFILTPGNSHIPTSFTFCFVFRRRRTVANTTEGAIVVSSDGQMEGEAELLFYMDRLIDGWMAGWKNANQCVETEADVAILQEHHVCTSVTTYLFLCSFSIPWTCPLSRSQGNNNENMEAMHSSLLVLHLFLIIIRNNEWD